MLFRTVSAVLGGFAAFPPLALNPHHALPFCLSRPKRTRFKSLGTSRTFPWHPASCFWLPSLSQWIQGLPMPKTSLQQQQGKDHRWAGRCLLYLLFLKIYLIVLCLPNGNKSISIWTYKAPVCAQKFAYSTYGMYIYEHHFNL